MRWAASLHPHGLLDLLNSSFSLCLKSLWASLPYDLNCFFEALFDNCETGTRNQYTMAHLLAGVGLQLPSLVIGTLAKHFLSRKKITADNKARDEFLYDEVRMCSSRYAWYYLLISRLMHCILSRHLLSLKYVSVDNHMGSLWVSIYWRSSCNSGQTFLETATRSGIQANTNRTLVARALLSANERFLSQVFCWGAAGIQQYSHPRYVLLNEYGSQPPFSLPSNFWNSHFQIITHSPANSDLHKAAHPTLILWCRCTDPHFCTRWRRKSQRNRRGNPMVASSWYCGYRCQLGCE